MKSVHQAGGSLESEHGGAFLCDHREKVGSVKMEKQKMGYKGKRRVEQNRILSGEILGP